MVQTVGSHLLLVHPLDLPVAAFRQAASSVAGPPALRPIGDLPRQAQRAVGQGLAHVHDLPQRRVPLQERTSFHRSGGLPLSPWLAQAGLSAGPRGPPPLGVVPMVVQRVPMHAEGMALTIIAALQTDFGVIIAIGAADVDHSQGPGLPDGLQAVGVAPSGIGQDFAAVQALSFCSYLSLVLTAAIVYATSRKQFAATRASSLIVALMSIFLANFVSEVGIDPFAILVISLLLLWLDKPLVFASLVLLSAGINEKIPIVLATVLTFRWAHAAAKRFRFASHVQLSSAWLAVAAYFGAILLLRVPGNEAQTNPAFFLSNLRSALICTFSAKGFCLNVLPVLVLSVLAAFAARCPRFHVSDISGLIVLLALALVANVVYNVGRVVMYSYPLYLPPTACFIDNLLKLEEIRREAGNP